MDEATRKTLTTPEECEQFAINVEARWETGLAIEFYVLPLNSGAGHGAKTLAERAAGAGGRLCHECSMSALKGKKTRASRRYFERRGIISAVETVVNRSAESAGDTDAGEDGA